MGFCCKVRCAKNPQLYFARRLNAAMKGLGTDEDTLIRLIVGRSEVSQVSSFISRWPKRYFGLKGAVKVCLGCANGFFFKTKKARGFSCFSSILLWTHRSTWRRWRTCTWRSTTSPLRTPWIQSVVEISSASSSRSCAKTSSCRPHLTNVTQKFLSSFLLLFILYITHSLSWTSFWRFPLQHGPKKPQFIVISYSVLQTHS